jgi:hypothetical protein
MECAERDRLWEEYNRSVELLEDCVRRLESASPTALSSAILAALAASDLSAKAREIWVQHLTTRTS